MHWRKTQPALVVGSIEFLSSSNTHLLFVRRHQGQAVLCCFNFSATPASLPLASPLELQELNGHGFASISGRLDKLVIPAHGALFARVI